MLSCRFEDGNETTNLRHATTDVILLNEKDEVLLTKRAPHLNQGGKWGMLGGYIDRDERVAEAAIREVREESGYAVTLERLLAVVDSPERGEDRQNIMFLFVGRVGEKVGEPDHESSELRWFPLDALPDRSSFAFDHYDCVQLYRSFKETPHSTPLFFMP